MTDHVTKIVPSLLSADFSRLGEEMRHMEQAGADWFHIDVMDGHFVPNLTIGPPVISALRQHSANFFDVHLMIAPVEAHLEAFAKAGADRITVHMEAGPHPHRSLMAIKSLGKKAGIALNPATSIEGLPFLLELVDLILIMTVNPGFGGQKFIAEMLPKIAAVKKMVGQRAIHIGVDGGIAPDTIAAAVEAGANILIAGAALFKGDDYRANMAMLSQASVN